MYADDQGPDDPTAIDSANTGKSLSNKTSSKDRSQANDAVPEDYGDEGDHYQNDEVIEDETNPVDGQNNPFGDSIPSQRPDQQVPAIETNKKPTFDLTSTSRLPFVPSNFWRELFAKPGILVGTFSSLHDVRSIHHRRLRLGIIGGVVIGMLSAILLVMFIIYRMRKKDEGSYALEEGPRKSPSHAYTRVSSREFFA